MSLASVAVVGKNSSRKLDDGDDIKYISHHAVGRGKRPIEMVEMAEGGGSGATALRRVCRIRHGDADLGGEVVAQRRRSRLRREAVVVVQAAEVGTRDDLRVRQVVPVQLERC